MSSGPKTERVKAIDVKPYEWALWCTVGGGKPFANTIEHRKWSEDGQRIWFMLGSHNYLNAAPDEELDLVPLGPCKSATSFDQAKFIASRPTPTKPCATCNGAGKVPA